MIAAGLLRNGNLRGAVDGSAMQVFVDVKAQRLSANGNGDMNATARLSNWPTVKGAVAGEIHGRVFAHPVRAVFFRMLHENPSLGRRSNRRDLPVRFQWPRAGSLATGAMNVV